MQTGSEAIAEAIDFAALAQRIKAWGVELGFAKIGVTGVDLREDEARLQAWLEQGRHGSMDYMQRHGSKRSRPDELQPGTVRVISARMDYFPRGMKAEAAWRTLADGERAYISRYALGRDYHKLIRSHLQKLADRIAGEVGPFGYRAFTDSAPVMEKALARNAGLGWVGKHTLVLDRDAGSWFFLGELFTDLPLPVDKPSTAHCGTCTRCIDVCPTQAIVGPYQLDARRCISYLTIESKDAIPEDLRPLMGNRVFGCDDCQLVCPWNKFAKPTREEDFAPRHGLDGARLVELFAWTEAEFLKKTEGMPIRRAGFEGFSRNVAVALGNAPHSEEVMEALRARAEDPSSLVREHVGWALARQREKGRQRMSREPDLVTPPHLMAVLDELRRREPIFHHPGFGTSRSDYARMTVDDFWEIGASGQRYSRDHVLDVLDARRSDPVDESDCESRDFHVRELAPDVYLLTYTLRQGTRLTRRSTIWRRVGEDWKIVFHQGTVVATDAG